ncbi:vacuolar protein sorting-associated protein 45-like protein [Angomonas deanei]|nr:vacuolar protein sorting-associated protein 45-like protein [Angomonas deanei]|eukprot:EPY39245.1 vacuolar protein sorting-associated protein 45-like protein [Angomonas deanei]
MKVLLVDDVTLPIISTSFSQTQLLKKGVFLVDQVRANRQRSKVKNMRCIIFIRPVRHSVDAACEELRMGKYSSYSIVFCGVASPEHLDSLARADVEQLVQRVQEAFCDLCVVNKDVFLIEHNHPDLHEITVGGGPVPRTHGLFAASIPQDKVRRLAEGLASLFVAQRRRPHIRVQKRSGFACRVAEELMRLLKNDADLYNYRSKNAVLLLLDRSDDPVTPLLTPWTYQAMLHEHLGLHHNTLHLPANVKDADPDGYVLSEQDDLFFAANMFLNWGDLCNNVKTYVDRCKSALNLDRSTATMDEIKDFMQRIGQTKSLAGSVAKHATITTHLSHVVKERDLLQVSLLEQDMVASYNMNDHFDRLQNLMKRQDIQVQDKVRLCLLFNLRYESPTQNSRVQAVLNNSSTSGYSRLIEHLRHYYGTDRNTEELFAETGVLSSIVRTFVDVGNIYTQHQPVLKKTLLKLLTDTLDQSESTQGYPYRTPAPPGGTPFKPEEVIVFMCGGCTLEEAALVHHINHRTGGVFGPNEMAQMSPEARVLLGADALLNTELFVKSLASGP